LLAAGTGPAGADFVPLGDLPGGIFQSAAFAVSADGKVVVGSGTSAAGTEAFRWTATTGMVGLGDLPGGQFYSEAFGVSADGSVVVGGGTTASSGPNFEAFRWTAATGMVGLVELQGRAGLSVSSLAQGVSADGSVVVGFGRLRRGVGEFVYDFEPFRWTQAGGMVSLGSLMGQDGEARGVSADGKVIVGNFPG